VVEALPDHESRPCRASFARHPYRLGFVISGRFSADRRRLLLGGPQETSRRPHSSNQPAHLFLGLNVRSKIFVVREVIFEGWSSTNSTAASSPASLTKASTVCFPSISPPKGRFAM
jgi:hypothetical protein